MLAVPRGLAVSPVSLLCPCLHQLVLLHAAAVTGLQLRDISSVEVVAGTTHVPAGFKLTTNISSSFCFCCFCCCYRLSAAAVTGCQLSDISSVEVIGGTTRVAAEFNLSPNNFTACCCILLLLQVFS